MKIGSKIAAAMPLPSVTYMARRASPAPRKMPVVHMPTDTIGVDGSTIWRKRTDWSSVAPVAPSAAVISRRNGHTAAEIAAVVSAMNTSEAPASRAASSRLPRPSERDTSAPVGDGEADRHRDGEEQQRCGEADGRGQRLHAEQRDVEQVERIDDEDGDQPDRAGRRHDDDVAHRRARDEFGGVCRWTVTGEGRSGRSIHHRHVVSYRRARRVFRPGPLCRYAWLPASA